MIESRKRAVDIFGERHADHFLASANRDIPMPGSGARPTLRIVCSCGDVKTVPTEMESAVAADRRCTVCDRPRGKRNEDGHYCEETGGYDCRASAVDWRRRALGAELLAAHAPAVDERLDVVTRERDDARVKLKRETEMGDARMRGYEDHQDGKNQYENPWPTSGHEGHMGDGWNTGWLLAAGNAARAKLFAAEATLTRAWKAIGTTEEAAADDPETADLADSIRVSLQYEKDRCALAIEQLSELEKLLNTPEVIDFAKAVQLEAAHQRQRWGVDHDAGKTDPDWLFLIGWLGSKAVLNPGGDPEKQLHRIVTVAAAAANWHLFKLGKTNMRPGIAPPPGEEAPVTFKVGLCSHGDGICAGCGAPAAEVEE